MPVIVRYYLMALGPPAFLASATVLVLLNLLFYLNQFLEYLFVDQAGVINSFLLLLYYQPSFLVLAIPIGFLVALLVVYGRLSADREVMALEASGSSIWILVWPMVAVSVLLSIFLVIFMDTLLPWGNMSFLKLQYKIITEKSAIIIRENVFIRDFNGYILYVHEKDEKKNLLKNIEVQILDEKGYPYRLVLAQNGTLGQDLRTGHVVLDLSDGIMQQVGSKKNQDNLESFFQMQFKTCALDLDAGQMRSSPMDFRDARNVSLKELWAQISEKKEQKVDTRYEELEFFKKFSLPFSSLAFALIGIPLGLISRSGSYAGPFLAVVIVVIYQLFLQFGEAGGPMGVISPFMAMWLPNFVLVFLGFLMILMFIKKNQLKFVDIFSNLVRKIKKN